MGRIRYSTSVSWSSGGCTGSSTGKLLQTYRADVSGALPLDAGGNPAANGSFEVRLPSVGSSAPLTLGATLVVIYRIPTGAGGPNIPLNSIVIYDGDYSQSNSQLTMTQQLQGFYDADEAPVSRLTHIVGNGKSNKYETVYLGSGNNKPTPLSSPYGKMLPPFPGWYGTWDNTTWTFSGKANPVSPDASSVTTQVVPSMSNQGCVSWGAIIVSTTVNNPDHDGILHSWKTDPRGPGYCDVSMNPSCTGPRDPAWVDLTGALAGEQDVFLQYDYMCSSVSSGSCASGGGNYSFDPRLAVDPTDPSNPRADAVDKVVAAYAGHNIHLHAIPGNAILEGQTNVSCLSTDPSCIFPNEPGTVGFREGLTYIKNQTIDSLSGVLGCSTTGAGADPNCVPVFQHGKKDSYHYALFSHGVGLPNWFLSDGSLASVKQTGNIVTFTTKLPHGISQVKPQPPGTGVTAPDTMCLLGRVTVIFAATNSNLNGTYCVLAKPAPTANTFAISVGGNATTFTYTPKTDPNLSVANGQVTSMSGYSDVGGQSSVISLGEGGWGPPTNPTSDGNTWQVKAGTFMHELGHTMGLTHGGTWYNNLAKNDYTPTLEANCKPNVQSIMSYSFQVDLLQTNRLNSLNQPLMVVDYSGQALPTLMKSSPEAKGALGGADYATTSWFQLTSYLKSPLALTSVANASGGSTVYTGTITGGGGNAFAGVPFTVAGFTNAADNGTFTATASTTTTLTLSNASGVAGPGPGTASPGVSPHCDGTPLLATDQAMSNVGQQPVGSFFWSPGTGEDINFDGNSTDVLHGHDEWNGTAAEGGVGLAPGLDLQQISALGTTTTSGLGGESGLGHPGGGGLGHPGGGGLGHPGGGGLGHPGGGGISDVTHETANSYTRPPDGLAATEGASPRTITLNWFQPTFGQIVQYNVYRAVGGGAFSFLASVFPTPPATAFPPTTYTDNPNCNAGGYSYKVTALVLNDVTGQPQESVASNTASTSGQTGEKLTGCYTNTPPTVTLNDLSFAPSSAVQGSPVNITWSLQDDDTGNYVNASTTTYPLPLAALTANSLYAIGPVSNDGCTTVTQGRIPLVVNGAVQNGAGTFSQAANTFTFSWNTDPFCAGSYTFELDTDSAQTETTASGVALSIDINDQDTPRITTLGLPNGTVGLVYPPYTLTEDGGTPTFTWTVTGLPSGISQQPPPNSATLSGTTCAAGTYPVTATVTDSATKPNSGSQGFSLQINKANTTTSAMSNANPSVFQQPVTFTVTVTPQGSCGPPTGTVTLMDGGVPIPSASNLPLTGGTATFMSSALSVGNHTITASYGGDSNFNSSNGALSPSPTQVVNPAQTAISFSSISPSTAFVGQPITISYTFGVVAPGAGSPIAPTGNITLTATDGASPTPHNSSCVALPTLGGGMCTLSPAPPVAGAYSFTINYPGDGNFVASGANGNYNVNQLVFTTQPSNTGVGLTITPAVVVTARDSSNNTLTTFTGGITVAIGSGPGTLSGTTTQNAVAGVATFNDLSINQVANGYTLKASPDGVVFDATSTAFNIDTFYVDNQGNFGTLDLPTGTVTQIAPATVPGSNGIDLTPGLRVYAYNASNQLMQITPSTRAATAIGSPGSIPTGDQVTTGATTDGSYFAIDAVTGTLYSIDLANGATNQVGSGTGTGVIVPSGCNLESSLSGSATTLYYTVGYSGASCSSPLQDTLYVIDPASGSSTSTVAVAVGGSPTNGFVGSAFVSGTLYGFTAGGGEYSIIPGTGIATLMVNTNPLTPIVAAGSSQ